MTQDSLFFARAKINFRLFFFSLSRQYGSDMFWAALLSSVSICTGLVETPELSHHCLTFFPEFFGDNIFFHFFFFHNFFSGGQDGQNSGIPENSGELDRLYIEGNT